MISLELYVLGHGNEISPLGTWQFLTVPSVGDSVSGMVDDVLFEREVIKVEHFPIGPDDGDAAPKAMLYLRTIDTYDFSGKDEEEIRTRYPSYIRLVKPK